MNRTIRHGCLDVAVNTILRQQEEDRCWSMYLASVSNPLSEQSSFNDWLTKIYTDSNRVAAPMAEMHYKAVQKDVWKQVEEAEKILKKFVPPMKGEA